MDAIYIVDVAHVLIASICAGFVVYGGWLCFIDWSAQEAYRGERAGEPTGAR